MEIIISKGTIVSYAFSIIIDILIVTNYSPFTITPFILIVIVLLLLFIDCCHTLHCQKGGGYAHLTDFGKILECQNVTLYDEGWAMAIYPGKRKMAGKNEEDVKDVTSFFFWQPVILLIVHPSFFLSSPFNGYRYPSFLIW